MRSPCAPPSISSSPAPPSIRPRRRGRRRGRRPGRPRSRRRSGGVGEVGIVRSGVRTEDEVVAVERDDRGVERAVLDADLVVVARVPATPTRSPRVAPRSTMREPTPGSASPKSPKMKMSLAANIALSSRVSTSSPTCRVMSTSLVKMKPPSMRIRSSSVAAVSGTVRRMSPPGDERALHVERAVGLGDEDASRRRRGQAPRPHGGRVDVEVVRLVADGAAGGPQELIHADHVGRRRRRRSRGCCRPAQTGTRRRTRSGCGRRSTCRSRSARCPTARRP